MKFKLEIKMDNAAFEDQEELSEILFDLAERLKRGYDPNGDEFNIQDSNGNSVGKAFII